MVPTVEPAFHASVTHGGRHYLPDDVPATVVLHVAALGPGWCELTTDAVPHGIFRSISPGSRHRLILPKALQPWFQGWETPQTLCFVQTSGSSVDILIADVRHARRALAAHAVDEPRLYRWASTTSPWRPPRCVSPEDALSATSGVASTVATARAEPTVRLVRGGVPPGRPGGDEMLHARY